MRSRSKVMYAMAMLLVGAFLAAQFAAAQARPKVTAVEPAAAKVNADVTLTGENLGTDAVKAVFLSDNDKDYKATVVDQAGEKIVMKVPQVKAGRYNVSIQVGDQILILPVRLSVEE